MYRIENLFGLLESTEAVSTFRHIRTEADVNTGISEAVHEELIKSKSFLTGETLVTFYE